MEFTFQAFNQWFNKQATKKKYLLEQIAALQVYLSDTKMGSPLKPVELILSATLINEDLDL